MACTRSKKNAGSQNKLRLSKSNLEKKFGIRHCVVRIERLTSQQMLKFTGKCDKKSSELPNVPVGRREQPRRAARQPKTIKIEAPKATTRTQSKSLSKTNTKSKKDKVPIQVGQNVLARQKYSVPWPSKILSIRAKYVDVYFYGDGRRGPVERAEITLISESNDVILKCLRKKIPNYLKGIIELERLTNVPDNLSITNLIWMYKTIYQLKLSNSLYVVSKVKMKWCFVCKFYFGE